MGKLLAMLLFVFAINLSMVMFLGTTAPGSSFWTLITQPEQWSSLSLLSLITDSIALVGVGIVIGSFWTKSDILLFAGISTVFLSFGVALAELYTVLQAYPQFASNTYLTTIIISPILIAYIYTLLLFWRGRD